MSIEANPMTVRQYLVKHYGVTEAEATKLVKVHEDIVTRAFNVRSYAYYPANQIAAAEGLIELDVDEDEDE